MAVGVLTVVALVNWYLLFPALLLVVLVYYLRSIYIKTGRDVKRIEALSKECPRTGFFCDLIDLFFRST